LEKGLNKLAILRCFQKGPYRYIWFQEVQKIA